MYVILVAHVDEVIEAIFSFITLLKAKGPQQWIYEELAVSGQIQQANIKISNFCKLFTYIILWICMSISIHMWCLYILWS